MKEQIATEMHRAARVNFPRRHTRIDGLCDLVQIDLIDLVSHKKENKNFGYILIAIDCFSKYVWAYPLKTKSANEVSIAINVFLKEFRKKYKCLPKLIQSDDGREFYNSQTQKLFKENNIKHYSSFSAIKAAIVERVIRTIKSRLFKHFSVQGTYRWVDILNSIVKAYNNTKHSVIKTTPAKVNKSNEKSVLFNIRLKQKRNQPSSRKNLFNVGDRVRISKKRSAFSKSYTPNWSDEIFIIDNIIKNSNPVIYKIKDSKGEPILGSFYFEELKKTNIPEDVFLISKVLKRMKNKLYVLWTDGTKSWLNKKDILV